MTTTISPEAIADRGFKLLGDVADFTKANADAFVASSTVAANGLQALAQKVSAYGQLQAEAATTAVKGLTSAKSPSDLFKLQSDYARAAFDSLVSESSKVADEVGKLVGEIVQPISTSLFSRR